MKNDGKTTLARVRQDQAGIVHVSYDDGTRVELTPQGAAPLVVLLDMIKRARWRDDTPSYQRGIT